MQEIHTLLNQRWVLKSREPELYYKLKDNHHLYSDFMKQKLGYNLILNPLMVKAEKLPGKASATMGIEEFAHQRSYVFLCLILMYLEEKEIGEQFVLADLIDFVKNQYPVRDEVDWAVHSHRKHLIQVLRFCLDENLLIMNDGDLQSFVSSEKNMEVLYENTGVSKYMMRRFSFDVTEIRDVSDFERLTWQSEDLDRGIVRRHRVYRRLLMEPIVYEMETDDQDYLYIKNQRSVIKHDVETYLGGDFHLHKNGALVLLKQACKNSFPDTKNIKEIVIQLCSMLQDENLDRDERDIATLSHIAFEKLIDKLRDRFSSGWTIKHRDMVDSQLMREIKQIMLQFKMIELDTYEIKILPMVGKVRGDYPKEYWERNNG